MAEVHLNAPHLCSALMSQRVQNCNRIMLLFHCTALQTEPVTFSCTAVIKREQPETFGFHLHFGHSLQLNAGSVTAEVKKYPQRETDPCWSLFSSPESKPRKATVSPLVLCSDQTYHKLFVRLDSTPSQWQDVAYTPGGAKRLKIVLRYYCVLNILKSSRIFAWCCITKVS